MNSEALMSMALGLELPWKIKSVELKKGASECPELHIDIGFTRGSRFPDGEGKLCPVHDTQSRRWQHLNFFEHACFIHCDVPRIKTSEGKIIRANVPWARKNSGFTSLFEAYAMVLIESEMPVNKVGRLMRVNPNRIWTIFNHWIRRAYVADDPSSITQLGIDETSRRKGHQYITLGVDMQSSRVIHVTKGKGKQSVHDIAHYLSLKGVAKRQIKQVSMDLSPAFISAAMQAFPKASIHFDRFHVVKLLNEAMDEVRRAEAKEYQQIKGHRYTFLRNPANLSEAKKLELKEMISLYPTLGEAYRMKETFQLMWQMPDQESASRYVDLWCDYAINYAGIPAFAKFAKTVLSHKSGIINFIESRITNAVLEGINSKVQLAKRRARGYRNLDNFINMIYFLCGKLRFDYPLYST
jgi:transposase